MAKCVSLVVLMAILATASAAVAAPATLILRSGDRVRGDLIDMNAGGFLVRARGGEQQIPTGDVAVIIFSGNQTPASETSQIQNGRAFVVLNDGETFSGRLFDIGGANPLRVSFRTPDGDRDVNSDQIARIYLSRWEGMPAGGAQPEQPALDAGLAGTTVPANQCWTNTRMTVRRGQRVTFSGSGQIQLSSDRDDIAGVAGSRKGRVASNGPLPGALAGALIGRVGSGQAFGIGDQTVAIPMPATGQLFLGINDDHCPDNRGQFKVQINILR